MRSPEKNWRRSDARRQSIREEISICLISPRSAIRFWPSIREGGREIEPNHPARTGRTPYSSATKVNWPRALRGVLFILLSVCHDRPPASRRGTSRAHALRAEPRKARRCELFLPIYPECRRQRRTLGCRAGYPRRLCGCGLVYHCVK